MEMERKKGESESRPRAGGLLLRFRRKGPQGRIRGERRASKLYCSAGPHVNWARGLQMAVSGAARAEKRRTNLL